MVLISHIPESFFLSTCPKHLFYKFLHGLLRYLLASLLVIAITFQSKTLQGSKHKARSERWRSIPPFTCAGWVRLGPLTISLSKDCIQNKDKSDSKMTLKSKRGRENSTAVVLPRELSWVSTQRLILEYQLQQCFSNHDRPNNAPPPNIHILISCEYVRLPGKGEIWN